MLSFRIRFVLPILGLSLLLASLHAFAGKDKNGPAPEIDKTMSTQNARATVKGALVARLGFVMMGGKSFGVGSLAASGAASAGDTLRQKGWDLVRITGVTDSSITYTVEQKNGQPREAVCSLAEMPYLVVQVSKNGNAIVKPTKGKRLTLCGDGLWQESQWGDVDQADHFAAAWNYLIWGTSPEGQAHHVVEQQAFQQQIAAWRAGGSKVVLPDEALRHKVLAEAAFQDKNFQKAADEYEAGLAIYPTWPEGQFACAAIEGQLKDYDDAIAHMKAYLELVPNAPNAEKAKEQIWIWQDAEKTGGN